MKVKCKHTPENTMKSILFHNCTHHKCVCGVLQSVSYTAAEPFLRRQESPNCCANHLVGHARHQRQFISKATDREHLADTRLLVCSAGWLSSYEIRGTSSNLNTECGKKCIWNNPKSSMHSYTIASRCVYREASDIIAMSTNRTTYTCLKR